ncbi:MAG: hypothetical protein KDC05_17035 [Bacteroidales bacterium]|nr:hypothetical protein [Bacteroidales bacterium]
MNTPQFITNDKGKKLKVILSMDEYTRLTQAEKELKKLKVNQKLKEKSNSTEAIESRMKAQLYRKFAEE